CARGSGYAWLAYW
nr:immunoglobulin heavy chain junction region [Mus musculus]